MLHGRFTRSIYSYFRMRYVIYRPLPQMIRNFNEGEAGADDQIKKIQLKNSMDTPEKLRQNATSTTPEPHIEEKAKAPNIHQENNKKSIIVTSYQNSKTTERSIQSYENPESVNTNIKSISLAKEFESLSEIKNLSIQSKSKPISVLSENKKKVQPGCRIEMTIATVDNTVEPFVFSTNLENLHYEAKSFQIETNYSSDKPCYKTKAEEIVSDVKKTDPVDGNDESVVDSDIKKTGLVVENDKSVAHHEESIPESVPPLKGTIATLFLSKEQAEKSSNDCEEKSKKQFSQNISNDIHAQTESLRNHIEMIDSIPKVESLLSESQDKHIETTVSTMDTKVEQAVGDLTSAIKVSPVAESVSVQSFNAENSQDASKTSVEKKVTVQTESLKATSPTIQKDFIKSALPIGKTAFSGTETLKGQFSCKSATSVTAHVVSKSANVASEIPINPKSEFNSQAKPTFPQAQETKAINTDQEMFETRNDDVRHSVTKVKGLSETRNLRIYSSKTDALDAQPCETAPTVNENVEHFGSATKVTALPFSIKQFPIHTYDKVATITYNSNSKRNCKETPNLKTSGNIAAPVLDAPVQSSKAVNSQDICDESGDKNKANQIDSYNVTSLKRVPHRTVQLKSFNPIHDVKKYIAVDRTAEFPHSQLRSESNSNVLSQQSNEDIDSKTVPALSQAQASCKINPTPTESVNFSTKFVRVRAEAKLSQNQSDNKANKVNESINKSTFGKTASIKSERMDKQAAAKVECTEDSGIQASKSFYQGGINISNADVEKNEKDLNTDSVNRLLSFSKSAEKYNPVDAIFEVNKSNLFTYSENKNTERAELKNVIKAESDLTPGELYNSKIEGSVYEDLGDYKAPKEKKFDHKKSKSYQAKVKEQKVNEKNKERESEEIKAEADLTPEDLYNSKTEGSMYEERDYKDPRIKKFYDRRSGYQKKVKEVEEDQTNVNRGNESATKDDNIEISENPEYVQPAPLPKQKRKLSIFQYLSELILGKKKNNESNRRGLSTYSGTRSMCSNTWKINRKPKTKKSQKNKTKLNKTKSLYNDTYITPDLAKRGLGAKTIREKRSKVYKNKDKKKGSRRYFANQVNKPLSDELVMPQPIMIPNLSDETQIPTTSQNSIVIFGGEKTVTKHHFVNLASKVDETEIKGGSQHKCTDKSVRTKLKNQDDNCDIDIQGGSTKCLEKIKSLKKSNKSNSCGKRNFSNFCQNLWTRQSALRVISKERR